MTATARRARFLRNAERRTRKAIAALRVLKRCANRRLHDFTEQEARAIVTAIQKETTALQVEFCYPEKVKFSLMEKQ